MNPAVRGREVDRSVRVAGDGADEARRAGKRLHTEARQSCRAGGGSENQNEKGPEEGHPIRSRQVAVGSKQETATPSRGRWVLLPTAYCNLPTVSPRKIR